MRTRRIVEDLFLPRKRVVSRIDSCRRTHRVNEAHCKNACRARAPREVYRIVITRGLEDIRLGRLVMAFAHQSGPTANSANGAAGAVAHSRNSRREKSDAR